MAFYYLLLGHLIGDFVLQTDKIAENKGRHWRWNLLHVLVVTLCILAFSYQFGSQLFLLVIVSGVVHFIVDYFKAGIIQKLRIAGITGFLADQSIHILLLFIISKYAAYENNSFVDFKTVRFLIVLSLVTSFSAVFTQYVLAALFPRMSGRFFEKGEKQIGILSRIYAAIVFYTAIFYSPYYLFLLPALTAAFIIQYKLGWKSWMSPLHLTVKLFLDTAVSAACVFLIL